MARRLITARTDQSGGKPFSENIIGNLRFGTEKMDRSHQKMPYNGFVLHGTVIGYYKDGSKKEETPWVQGKVNGTQIGYREDGSKAMETIYENGKKISRKEF